MFRVAAWRKRDVARAAIPAQPHTRAITVLREILFLSIRRILSVSGLVPPRGGTRPS